MEAEWRCKSSAQCNESTVSMVKLVAIGLFVFSVVAGMPSATAQESDSLAKLKRVLGERLPTIEITSMKPSPIAGVFEFVSGGQIYYVSGDGQFIIDGNVIDTVSRENITATRLGGVQLSLINALDESEMLVYEPEHTTDRSITIFTDTSCPYCSRLHAEIDELLDNGIRVRYLMFPRAGLGSESHQELESVWCADDPHTAMTIVKAGGVIESKTCHNPIQAHIALAEAVGLRGTPLIYLDSGQSIPGYRPVIELVQMINSSSPR